jgi:hypothetical protein
MESLEEAASENIGYLQCEKLTFEGKLSPTQKRERSSGRASDWLRGARSIAG